MQRTQSASGGKERKTVKFVRIGQRENLSTARPAIFHLRGVIGSDPVGESFFFSFYHSPVMFEHY